MLENEPNSSVQNVKLEQKKNRPKLVFREIVHFVFLVLVIVIPIRLFIAQPFIVSGQSMQPGFESNEYLIVDLLEYRFHDIQRGDVVVFRYPKDPRRFFVKRVIGLPGETVEFEDTSLIITSDKYPEGFTLFEPYIKQDTILYQKTTLGENEYFVLGDNRGASSDSRYWGPLPEENITGRVLLRLLPFSRIDYLPANFRGQY